MCGPVRGHMRTMLVWSDTKPHSCMWNLQMQSMHAQHATLSHTPSKRLGVSGETQLGLMWVRFAWRNRAAFSPAWNHSPSEEIQSFSKLDGRPFVNLAAPMRKYILVAVVGEGGAKLRESRNISPWLMRLKTVTFPAAIQGWESSWAVSFWEWGDFLVVLP